MSVVSRRGFLFGAIALVALITAGAFIAPAWMRTNDPLEPCDVLVLLNGHSDRVHEAVRLHRDGVGREVWLTSDPRSVDPAFGVDMGTRTNQRILNAGGVPEARIHHVPGAATGTRAELELIAAELRRRGMGCAVLVTSALHAPRVRVTWARVIGPAPRAIIRAIADADAYTAARRWQERGLTVLAFLGFPH